MEPTFTVAMRGYDRQQVDDYTATLRRMLDDAQRRAYAAAEAQAAADRERRVDEILAKISRQGADSLTSRERRTLEEATAARRSRR